MVNELSTSRHNALSSLVEELWDFVEDMPGLSENSKKNWCKVIDRLARSLQDEGTKQVYIIPLHFFYV